MKRIVLVAFLAACGGKSSGGGTTTSAVPTTGGSCETAGSNIATAVPDLDDAGMTAVANAIGEICVADAWSPEAIACFSGVEATQEAMEPCADKLTAAQQDSLGSQMAARAEEDDTSMDDEPEEPPMDDSELDDTEVPQ